MNELIDDIVESNQAHIGEQSVDIVEALLRQPTTELVSNVKTQIAALTLNNDRWPLTINQTEYDNAVICSPYTTYVTYPLDELKKISKVWVKCLVLLNTAIMSIICRLSKVNQIVQVNNNLNSLVRHPKIFAERLPQLTQQIISTYPKHAITFFRINAIFDEQFITLLKKQGYLVFPDRFTHLFFLHQSALERTDTKRDIMLLRDSSFSLVSHDALFPEDAERLAELYHQLFTKHSKFNPIYTAHYFRQAIQYRWHTYTALRNSDGRIDGFVSWFIVGDVLLAGPMGYDHSVDLKKGLYRQLVAIYLKYASDHKLIFNMGGGSDVFKRNRGSTQVLEYTAVYCKHLPRYRQIPWKIFHWSFHKFLKKIISESNL